VAGESNEPRNPQTTGQSRSGRRGSALLIPSPVGPLLAEHDGSGLRRIRFWPQGAHPPAGALYEPAVGDTLGLEIVRQLREYFAGERAEFTLPLAPEGTPFQWRVWEELCRIPVGQTRSYAAIARAIGRPGAARAVGQANRRNRIPIIVPCHRVVAADGTLGGYMGTDDESGTKIKRWLIGHERDHAPRLAAADVVPQLRGPAARDPT
jgi:methylated-DNA-[protein]-cysteine S-methyltransferase